MPINSIYNYNSISNFRTAGAKLQLSIAQLASGKRLAQASTDIASLAAATGLQSEVTGLRSALGNVSQGSSLLQVADGGLQQIGDVLQRLQALAVQSNSGTLGSASRQALNQEFQQLRSEIDRLSGNTNFAGVKLLDGSLSAGPGIQTTTTQATRATGALNFTGNVAAGQTLVINGTTLTEGVDFNAAGTIQGTVDNIVTALNNSTNTNLSGATYSRTGNTLNITADAAGSAGNSFTINRGASTASAAFTVVGPQIGASNVFSLQGGLDNGIAGNTVTASGAVTDTLLTGQSQQSANVTARFTSAANIVAGNTIQIDDGAGGFTAFTFVNGAPASNQQIQIGGTLEETLGNAAATLNAFSGPGDFGTQQLNFSVSNGTDLVISSKAAGNPLDGAGAALNVNLATAGGSLSSGTLNNGSSTGGVNTNGVSNAAFTGTIQGFTAQFTGNNTLQASIKVGNETYTANITNTNPGANTTVRFSSAGGGFFDVQLAGGNGQAVTNQSDADQFANRLDAAFKGLNFSQNRNVSDFSGVGLLSGASVQIQGSNFSGLNIKDISVYAAPGGAGTGLVEININGEVYRSSNVGLSISAGESIKLTSASNPNNVITFNNGTNKIDLSSTSGAQAFQTALENGFGESGGGGLQFQVGGDSSSPFNINIGSASSASLFGGKSLDLLSQGNAAAASSAIAAALDKVTSLRAEVGSAQQSFNYLGANLESALLNQDAARSVLEDTDFLEASINNSQARLQQQATTSVLAQTNRLAPSLLRLLVG